MPLFKRKKEQDKEIAVIGLGHFGGSLARRLETLGHRVLGIDLNPQLVKDIASDITEAVILDATDEEALQQVDITSFPIVVVAVSDNFEANALITTTVKKLGIPTVICESNTDRHREILLRIGADRVILPKEESGVQLADELSIPGMLELMPLSQDYSLIEINTPRTLVGKSLEACEPYDVIVVLLLRGNNLIVNPDQTTKFEAQDVLVLVGEKRRLAEFSSIG